MSDKTRFGIEVDRVARGWCNFGLCFTYNSTIPTQTYLNIYLFKWVISIGKFLK